MSEAFRRGIRPPSRLSPPEWAGKYVRVQNSERAPFFDIGQTPWWREPMECAADNEIKEIVVLAPTGSGKSTMAEALIPWVTSEDPGAFLYASQTDEDAKFWAESRLLPTLKSCEPLRALWPDDRHKSRKMEIIWPHMPMVLGGANMSNFQEKSVRWLYGDEVWKWKPGLVREFLARHHNRWNRRVFLVSQGGEVTDELTGEWNKTDRCEFSFRCPKCKELHAYGRQLLRFKRVKRDDGTIDEQASADTAHLVCPCGAKFKDTVGERRSLADSGEYVPAGDGKIRGYRGFHVHALAVWWVPWSEYVLELLAARRMLDAGVVDRYRQLIQKRDAEPWKDDMAVERKDLKRSGKRRDTIDPAARVEGERFRFLTVDKGGNHFWAVVRAWKDGGGSELLHESYVPADGEREARLKEVQDKFMVEDHLVFIDISFEWQETADLCAHHGWTGIRGDGQLQFFRWRDGTERPYSEVKQATGKRGGICKYVAIASNPIKDTLFRLSNAQGAEWLVLDDVSKAYRRHMKSEVRKEVMVGREKRLQSVWETTDRQNHLWDCECYQVAAAMIFGLFDAPEPG